MSHDTLSAPSRSTPSTGCGCGRPTCETCNSLRCLCRPRFFAGQLVTDTDFRRLDDYIVGKDRLHNRFLHGTGVACGLEVVCSACDDTVTVRPGYALGPCGEDIVVCANTRVPVGELIRAQRTAKARAADCGPYQSTPADCDNDALEQTWVLGICYDEQAGRPVRTLPTSTRSCGCGDTGKTGGSAGGCRCGGSSGSAGTSSGSRTSGCGCGGGCGSTSVSAASARAPAGCEPTVIQEGFRFTVTKVSPASLRGDSARRGPLAEKVQECISLVLANLSKVGEGTPTADFWRQFKADLQYVIDTGNVHDCTLGQRLQNVEITDNTAEVGRQLLLIAVEVLRSCLSSALLPPCPTSCDDDCVPIATLTVRSSDLRVLRVCNWSSRKFALTAPALGYWFGALPFGPAVRRLVTQLLCPGSLLGDFEVAGRRVRERRAEAREERRDEAREERRAEAPEERRDEARRAGPPRPQRWSAFARYATTEAGPTAEEAATFAELPAAARVAAQYIREPSTLSGLQSTLFGGLGFLGGTRATSVTDAELDDPMAAIALSELLGPRGLGLGAPLRTVLSAVQDVDLSAVADAFTSAKPAADKRAAGERAREAEAEAAARAQADENAARLARLEETITALQKKVTSQARTIAALRKKVDS